MSERIKAAWRYDGSVDRFPLKPGQLWACGLGRVMVNDLYDGLPDFMTEADCVFVDPPYNAALENGFRSKANLARNPHGFDKFLHALFARIDRIAPATCYVEIGKQHVQEVTGELRARFAFVDTYPATYYKRNPCFVVRGGAEPSPADYSGLDEQDIIVQICQRERYATIADLCMGRGAVGIAAYQAGRPFCGVELNPARLAVLVNRIHQLGGAWSVDGVPYQPPPEGAAA
jgi:hypothetical protein